MEVERRVGADAFQEKQEVANQATYKSWSKSKGHSQMAHLEEQMLLFLVRKENAAMTGWDGIGA